MKVFLRVAVAAVLVGLFAGPVAFATPRLAPATPRLAPATSGPHDSFETWRVHPSKQAARAARMTLKISDVGTGKRGAVMVVEDRHIPVTPFDTAGVYGFAYAELGNDDDYPQVYDNPDHVATPSCALPNSCLGFGSRPMDG